MAKRDRRGGEPREERDAAAYYRLHTKAVEDLAGADESNSPPVSEEELRKYRSGSKLRLADWVKAVLIKIWFAGSVCFFFLWGLGGYLRDTLDQMLVLGLALGLVTDLMVNSIFRYFAKEPGANDRWMLFPQKKLSGLFLNVLYGYLLLYCVYTTYNLINIVLLSLGGGEPGSVPLGVGPILFGVFTAAYDLLFLGMKRLLQRILRDARRNVELK